MIKTQSHSPLTGQPTIQYCLRCAQPEVQHQVISECQGELCWRHESELKSSISRETDFFFILRGHSQKFWEASQWSCNVCELEIPTNFNLLLLTSERHSGWGDICHFHWKQQRKWKKKKKHVLSLQVLISTKEGGWCHYPLERNIWCS